MTGSIVRIVGHPGSGKSLLITSLQEALRAHGIRSAAVVRRAPGTTSISISTGARTTLERDVPLDYLATVISWIDPTVEVILAESYEENGAPAVEIRGPDDEPLPIDNQELFAVVDGTEIALEFARRGPGYTAGVAERIQREILGREPSETGPGEQAGGGQGGLLGRVFRRIRG